MIKLHGNVRSGNTRKVRWALEEIGVPYELVPVALMQGEHKGAPYLALNPNGRVPTIDDEGFLLWESDAILWYLADTYGRGKLVPEAPKERALVHQWMSWNAYHLADVLRARAARMTAMLRGTPLDEKRYADLVASAQGLLSIFENALAGRKHLVGDQLSIADLAVGFTVTIGKEEGLKIDASPNVARWAAELTARPAFERGNAQPV